MRWPSLLLATAVAAVGPFGPGGAGVEGKVARAESTTERATKKQSTTKSKASKTKKKKKRVAKASKRKKKKGASREASREPNRRTASNMPRGWSWPPNKSMVKKGERCTGVLDGAGIGWKPAPAEGKIATPIVLDSLTVGGVIYHPTFRKPPFPMDCHLALALATHSPTLYSLGVRKVHFGSIYRNTKVRAHGKTKNVLSRHALGLAMDVVSFEGEDGAVFNVEKDYPLGAELLLAVEDTLNATGGFRTVLTPRNDPTSHHDHFHIEAEVSYYEDERNLAGLRASGTAAAVVKADEPPPSDPEEKKEEKVDEKVADGASEGDQPVTSTRTSDREARSSKATKKATKATRAR
jgi:hypothetical protein